MANDQSDVGPGGGICTSVAQLVCDVADGDTDAFTQLYDLFADRVYRTTRAGVSDRAQAEKAAQDVFLRVWRTASRYDPRRETVAQWITALTHQEVVVRNRPASGRRHCVWHRTGHPAGAAVCRRDAADPT